MGLVGMFRYTVCEYLWCHIRLEIENARLDAAAKQQSNKIEALQKGAQEFAMVSAVHTHTHSICFVATYLLITYIFYSKVQYLSIVILGEVSCDIKSLTSCCEVILRYDICFQLSDCAAGEGVGIVDVGCRRSFSVWVYLCWFLSLYKSPEIYF